MMTKYWMELNKLERSIKEYFNLTFIYNCRRELEKDEIQKLNDMLLDITDLINKLSKVDLWK